MSSFLWRWTGKKRTSGTRQSMKSLRWQDAGAWQPLELLEDRLAPAVTSLVGSTLTIDLQTADEVRLISNTGTNINISGVNTGDGSTFSTAAVARIVVKDSVGSTGQSVIFSGTGNFSLSGGLDISGIEDVSILKAIDTGTVGLSIVTDVSIFVSAPLTASDGNILLSANQQAIPSSGTFIGIDIFSGGSVTTTGAGTVTLLGKGGDSGNVNFGVRIVGDVFGASTTVIGTGGLSTGVANYGIDHENAGTITSTGGNVIVTGIGGGTGSTSTQNYGIKLGFGAKITAGGTGTVTATFRGGNVGSNATGNTGLLMVDSGTAAVITSGGGAVDITATGTNTSPAIAISNNSLITSGNNASITITTDSLSLTNAARIDSGTGTTTIKPYTAGTRLNLGGNDVLTVVPLILGLTDTELDGISAGNLILGDSNTGPITVSTAITRSAATNLSLITAANNTIAFTGTGSIDSAGGNVSLSTSGTGAITSGTASTNIAAGAGAVSLAAGSGGIGASGDPLVVTGTSLVTSTTGDVDQFLSTSGSLAIGATGLSAANGTIHLVGGTFVAGVVNAIVGSSVVAVDAGTLQVTANDALGNTTGGTTVASGAVLDLRGVTYSSAEPLTLAGGNLAATLTSSFAGPITLTADSRISPSSSRSITLNGAISGDFTLQTFGAGATVFNNTGSTFSRLVITAGVAMLGGDNTLPSTIDISNSSTFDLNGSFQSIDFYAGAGTTRNTGAGGARLNLGLANSVSSLGSPLYAGPITGNIEIAKYGTGTQRFSSNSSDYTGSTNVFDGTLEIAGSSSLGSTILNTSVFAGTTLSFRGVAYSLSELVLLVSGTLSATTGISSLPGTILLSSSNNTILVTGTQLTLSGVITGTSGFIKSGTGTLVLTNGANDYAGNTVINSGPLQLGAANVIPDGAGKGDIIFNPTFGTATLDLAGFNETINGLSSSGAGTSRVINSTGTSTLTVGADNDTSTFAGVLQDSTGTLSLTKVGTGTLTLTGTNTYSGPTTIDTGRLNVVGSITSDVTVNTNGTLGGTGTINGSVSGTGTIAPGSSPGKLTINGNFAPAGIVAFEVNPPAAVAGTNYDQIVVGGSIDLSTATLQFTGATPPPSVAANQIITLIDNVTGNPIIPSPSFSQGSIVTINGTTYQLFYQLGGSNDLVLRENTAATTVYVSPTFTDPIGTTLADADLGTNGNQPATIGIDAFSTIADALAAVADGGTIIVNSGNYAEAVTLTTTRVPTFRITGVDTPQSVTLGSLSTAIGVTVQIEGNSILTVGSDNSSTTIAGSITGTGSLVKEGTGTLTLSGTNTYSGDTTVAQGTLAITNGNGLGSTTGGTTVANGATLDLLANIGTEALTIRGTGVSGIGALITSTGNGTVNGPMTLTADTSLGGNGNLTIGGPIDGNFSLFKVGAGTITLVGTNTFTGTMFVTAGTLALVNGAAIPDSVGVVVSSGAGLRIDNSETVGSLAGAGSINLQNSTLTLGGDNTSTILSGIVSGSGNLIKKGTGTLTLAGSNLYTGETTIDAGTVQVTNFDALGGTAGKTTVNSGAVLDFVSINYTTPEPITIAGGTLSTSTGTSSFSGPITLVTADATILVAGTKLTLTGIIDGTQGLIKTGAGILTLSGANSYAGDTVISNGTLQLGAANVIPDGAGKGDVLLNPSRGSATLDLAGFNETINGLSSSGVGPSQVINSTGAITLTVGADNDTSTFAGTLEDSTGTLSLTKVGTGTLTLTGTNTFSGPTTVSGGTLLVNGTNSGTGAVAVNAGGTLGGEGSLAGAVTVGANGRITGGTLGGVGTLTVGALAFNGGTLAADFDGNKSDTIATAGSVDLSASAPGIFSKNSQTGTTTAGTIFTLIDSTGSGAILNPPLTNANLGSIDTINGQSGVYSYSSGTAGNDFAFVTSGTQGVAITPSSGNLVITEGGTGATFTVALTSQPVSDVAITITGMGVNVAPTTLTFTPANWAINQTVTVTAPNNSIVDGSRSGQVSFTVTSIDGNYNGQAIPPISVTINDDDIPTRLDLVGGSGQTTLVGTAFSTPLSVEVRNAAGQIVTGVTVSFAVPGSDPTAVLSASSAVSNTNGIASVTATAGQTFGAYTVTASIPGVSPITVALTNAGRPQTIFFSTPAPVPFSATASVTLAATASSGLPVTYSIVSGPGVLNGNILTATTPGTVIVRATQSGNASDLAATPVEVSIVFRPVGSSAFPEFTVSGDQANVSVQEPDGTTTTVPGAGPGDRAVIADVTGDGIADPIVATAPGNRLSITMTDGATGRVIRTFPVFEESFRGSATLTAGDVNGDGIADIAVGADAFGGPRVTVYDGATGGVLADFFAIEDSSFRGGVRVALGDVNGDGLADLAVAAGIGGGPRIALWDGASLRAGSTPTRLVADFFCFEPTLRNGANVDLGDVNGDGKADLILSGGPGGGPRVLIWDAANFLATNGATQTVLANFFADKETLIGGARVAAKDLDGDNLADLVVGIPTGPSTSVVRSYLGKNLTPSGTPPMFDELLLDAGGVYVG